MASNPAWIDSDNFFIKFIPPFILFFAAVNILLASIGQHPIKLSRPAGFSPPSPTPTLTPTPTSR